MEKMPPRLRQVVSGAAHRITQASELPTRHHRRFEVETRLQKRTLQGQITLLRPAIENMEELDPEEVTQTLRKSATMGKQARGGSRVVDKDVEESDDQDGDGDGDPIKKPMRQARRCHHDIQPL
jgi:hypothetical protein